MGINLLNAELMRICHLLELLGAHHILHVSGVRVKGYFVHLVTYVLMLLRSGLLQPELIRISVAGSARTLFGRGEHQSIGLCTIRFRLRSTSRSIALTSILS